MPKLKNWDEAQQKWIYSDNFIGGINAPYEIGDVPPSDKKLFWINTADNSADIIVPPKTERQNTPVGIGEDRRLYVDTGLMTVSDSGEVISSDCVSDYTHEVDCKIERINLINCYNKPCVDGGRISINKLTEPGYYSTEAFLANGTSLDEVLGAKISINFYDASDEYVFSINGIGRLITQDMIDKVASGTGIFFYNLADYASESPTFSANLTKGQKGIGHAVPYVPDLAKVKVSRYGKNIAETKYSAPEWILSKPLMLIEGVSYTISLPPLSDKRSLGFVNTGDYESFEPNSVITNPNNNVFTFTPKHTGMGRCNSYCEAAPYTTDSRFMLEIGKKASPYEPTQKTDFIPAADGTVNGMTSLSPNLTIMSDTPGVNISATYFADSALYYKNQFNAVNTQLQTLSNNAVSYDELNNALSKGVNSI